VLRHACEVPEAAEGRYSPAELHRRNQDSNLWRSRPKALLDALRGAQQSQCENALATNDAPYECVFKEDGESPTRDGAALPLYNYVRIHRTLKTTPAMADGVTDRLWEVADVVSVLESWEAAI
jgi:hypothetical protein